MLLQVHQVHPAPFPDRPRIRFRVLDVREIVVSMQGIVQSVLIVMNMKGKNGGIRLTIGHAVFHGDAPFAVRLYRLLC